MEKYQRGKVYAIICRKTGQKYIGSTCETTLARRLAKHVEAYKYYKEGNRVCMSYDIIKNGNYYIVLLETFPCNSKDELRMCEQKHMDLCECINKVKAYISEEDIKQQQHEWYKKNIEMIKEKSKQYAIKNIDKVNFYKKKYAENHREEINKKNSEKYECECGCIIRKDSKLKHEKTKKHNELVQFKK